MAVRKTVQAEKSRFIGSHDWLIMGLSAISLRLSWGALWQMDAMAIEVALVRGIIPEFRRFPEEKS